MKRSCIILVLCVLFFQFFHVLPVFNRSAFTLMAQDEPDLDENMAPEDEVPDEDMTPYPEDEDPSQDMEQPPLPDEGDEEMEE